MAGRGPAPKKEVRRRNERPEPVKIAADEQLRGSDLPEGYDWHFQTLKWWETWRRSPQAQTFTDTDWSFLLDTAMLHSALWSGRTDLASEVRLRAAKFGATPEDRARLKLEIVTPSDRPAKPRKTASSDPRARFKVVGGTAS